MNPVRVSYLGYVLSEMLDGMVDVYDPEFDFSPVYTAVDYDVAKRWVRAYKAGEVWAMQEALF